jgi:hypothetical protein
MVIGIEARGVLGSPRFREQCLNIVFIGKGLAHGYAG